MAEAIYVASFNPITNGHIDILVQSLRIFDKVYVCVANNSNKKYDISSSERLVLVKEAIQEHYKYSEHMSASPDWIDEKIQVVNSTDKNIDELCESLNCYNVIRGLRAVSDYEYEAGLNLAYKQMNRKIQIVVFLANNKNMYVSSSIVREIYKVRGQCIDLVPKCVHEFMLSKFR